MDGMGTSSADVELLGDEVAQLDNVSRKVGAELEALKVELQSPPRVTLVADAAVPQTRDGSRRIKAVAMAGIGALGFVALCVSWWELRANRINTADEISNR